MVEKELSSTIPVYRWEHRLQDVSVPGFLLMSRWDPTLGWSWDPVATIMWRHGTGSFLREKELTLCPLGSPPAIFGSSLYWFAMELLQSAGIRQERRHGWPRLFNTGEKEFSSFIETCRAQSLSLNSGYCPYPCVELAAFWNLVRRRQPCPSWDWLGLMVNPTPFKGAVFSPAVLCISSFDPG